MLPGAINLRSIWITTGQFSGEHIRQQGAELPGK